MSKSLEKFYLEDEMDSEPDPTPKREPKIMFTCTWSNEIIPLPTLTKYLTQFNSEYNIRINKEGIDFSGDFGWNKGKVFLHLDKRDFREFVFYSEEPLKFKLNIEYLDRKIKRFGKSPEKIQMLIDMKDYHRNTLQLKIRQFHFLQERLEFDLKQTLWTTECDFTVNFSTAIPEIRDALTFAHNVKAEYIQLSIQPGHDLNIAGSSTEDASKFSIDLTLTPGIPLLMGPATYDIAMEIAKPIFNFPAAHVQIEFGTFTPLVCTYKLNPADPASNSLLRMTAAILRLSQSYETAHELLIKIFRLKFLNLLTRDRP